ncbi:MAG: hypothetical protein HYX92_09280 [Chloroflexi bacterium]|nr:hypothetical protein [Chloroflexota bacterium]
MANRRSLIVASCFTVLGLLAASCAPGAVLAPAAKPPAKSATPGEVAKALNPTSAAPAPTAKPAATSATPGELPKAAIPAPATTPKPAADQPRFGAILTLAIGGDPPGLDPHREEASFGFTIVGGAYNRLVKYDLLALPQQKIIGDLATNWGLSPDGKVYTFHLVKAAKFHDGTPLVAEDVKFSYDRIRNPEKGTRSPRQQQLANVTNIDTPDDSTVKVALGYPQASFLTSMAAVFYSVVPKHVVLEKKGDLSKTVVGSGPFKFKDYATGVGWESVKNPDYFVKGRPYLDGVKGYVIKDSFTRFAALRTGNLRWWAPYPTMDVSQARIIETTMSDKVALQWVFQPSWYGLLFNVTKAPWNDVRLRQAVSLSFDRKKMVATGLQGAGIVGMAAQPVGEFALPEEEMAKVPGYAKPDVEGAKKLLAEAGFPHGLSTQSLVRAVKEHENLGVLLRDAVATIGISLDLKVVETAIFNDARFRKAFDISGTGAGSPLSDPDTLMGDYYLTNAARNWTGYSNPYYDELYVKQSQAVDPGERRKVVWQMQRILLKDVPIALAYWTNIPYAWWREVRGFTPPPSQQDAYDFQEIWLAK